MAINVCYVITNNASGYPLGYMIMVIYYGILLLLLSVLRNSHIVGIIELNCFSLAYIPKIWKNAHGFVSGIKVLLQNQSLE